MKKTGIVQSGGAVAVIKERRDHIAVPGRTSAANTITLKHLTAIIWKADPQMRKIIIVDATLMNTEMTTIKSVNLDIATGTMKADTRTIVASRLVEVEEVVIKANTRFTTVLHISIHMG